MTSDDDGGGVNRLDGTDRSRLGPTLVLVAAVTFVVAAAGLNARATYGAQVTADEPQYLLTALSIGEDLDLDIADELADERFLDFHELPLDPQTVELNRSAQRLSPHDPGLPVLLAGPMVIGGWQGAKLSLAALAALTAAVTAWVAIRQVGVTIPTAAVVTVALFASPPLAAYGTQVYPEMPAALLTMIGLSAVTGLGDRNRTRQSMIALTAIISLPWFSVKYVPVAAVIAVALLASLIPAGGGAMAVARPPWPSRLRPLVVPTAVLLVAGVVYLVVHQRIYGGWTVYAAGDHFVDGELLVIGDNPNYPARSRRLIGLLVDRSFGLVAWAPAYVMAVPAVAAMVGRRTQGWLLFTAVIAVGWAVATWVALTMHGWWWPGRQVVVVLPAVVVAMAALVDGRPRLQRLLVAASVAAVVNWLWLVIEAATGQRALIIDFHQTSSPLYRLWSVLLPGHQSPGPADWFLTAVWAVALVWLLVVGRRIGDRRRAGPLPSPLSAESVDQ